LHCACTLAYLPSPGGNAVIVGDGQLTSAGGRCR
jgi:hypothetical protein